MRNVRIKCSWMLFSSDGQIQIQTNKTTDANKINHRRRKQISQFVKWAKKSDRWMAPSSSCCAWAARRLLINKLSQRKICWLHHQRKIHRTQSWSDFGRLTAASISFCHFILYSGLFFVSFRALLLLSMLLLLVESHMKPVIRRNGSVRRVRQTHKSNSDSKQKANTKRGKTSTSRWEWQAESRTKKYLYAAYLLSLVRQPQYMQ